MRVQERDLRREFLGHENVVGIQARDELAGGKTQCRVVRRARAQVALLAHRANPWVVKLPDDFPGVVGRAVVDNDQFP